VIWKPGTRSVYDVRYPSSPIRTSRRQSGAQDRLRYRAAKTGRYFVHVKITKPGWARYKLVLVRK
jgi:hypothetical protein